MPTQSWTTDNLPDQQGQVVIITGANSGIGYEAAKVLAGKNARVILAVRSLEKGRAAEQMIKRGYPAAKVDIMTLDLADLSSVRRFVDIIRAKYTALPLLINNAGVMAIPYRQTADGFEMQFGTNHLGHFALTGLLLPLLLAAPGARVVTVSSGAHTWGRIDFENLDGQKRYVPFAVYGQSKLANLLFAYELQRRWEANGANARSVACHPGYVATNLQAAGPRMAGSRLQGWLMGWMNRLVAGKAEWGAWPTLYAALGAGISGGDYVGPAGRGRWDPVKARSSAASYDLATAQRLWSVSEQMTGVKYAFKT